MPCHACFDQHGPSCGIPPRCWNCTDKCLLFSPCGWGHLYALLSLVCAAAAANCSVAPEGELAGFDATWDNCADTAHGENCTAPCGSAGDPAVATCTDGTWSIVVNSSCTIPGKLVLHKPFAMLQATLISTSLDQADGKRCQIVCLSDNQLSTRFACCTKHAFATPFVLKSLIATHSPMEVCHAMSCLL